MSHVLEMNTLILSYIILSYLDMPCRLVNMSKLELGSYTHGYIFDMQFAYNYVIVAYLIAKVR